MRFNVIEAISVDPPLNVSSVTDLTAGNDPLLVPRVVTMPPPGVPVRSLTLNETFDGYGRLIQLLGTNVPSNNRGHGFGRAYMDSATRTRFTSI